jgi:hypothetical protein
VNCSLPKITYPTFKLLLLARLDQTICLQREVLLKKELNNPSEEASRGFQSGTGRSWIELKQVRNATAIVYTSPVALQLASCLHVSPLDLAREITENLSNVVALPSDNQDLNEELMKFIWENLNITFLTSGWIKFELRDSAWAKWLQFGLDHPPQLSAHIISRSAIAPELLACQYAYARCNALLRLGHQEQLIELSDWQPDWRWLAPAPLPWLAADRLRCQHPAEWQLLGQIAAVLDELFAPTATGLTQAWQAYDRACQIFGQTGIAALALAQSRLGLVMLTQRLLRLLLEQRLGVSAPFEL